MLAVPLSRLLRTLVRLYRLESNGGLLKNSSMLRFNPGLVRVGQLMLMLLLACHWAGCLWWLIGEIDMEGRELARTDPESNTWLASEWLQRQDLILRYSQSLLWGTGLMTTILPYDVVPRTITQTFVTIVVVAVGLVSRSESASWHSSAETAFCAYPQKMCFVQAETALSSRV